VGSSSLARDEALRPCNGSADSKTLAYKRTPNPRKYQTVRTPTKATTCVQDLSLPTWQEHPLQDPSSKQQTRQKQARCQLGNKAMKTKVINMVRKRKVRKKE